jgi:hypothetical protein
MRHVLDGLVNEVSFAVVSQSLSPEQLSQDLLNPLIGLLSALLAKLLTIRLQQVAPQGNLHAQSTAPLFGATNTLAAPVPMPMQFPAGTLAPPQPVTRTLPNGFSPSAGPAAYF